MGRVCGFINGYAHVLYAEFSVTFYWKFYNSSHAHLYLILFSDGEAGQEHLLQKECVEQCTQQLS